MSRQRSSIMGNPVLVGAVTTLLVTVGVFLAYNANSGLPFVPVHRVLVDVPTAQSLIVGAEVRVSGARVGRVTEVAPTASPSTGRSGARITLELDQTVTPVRSDSRIVIRPTSALGLEFVDLRPGLRGRVVPDGGSLPPTAALTDQATLGDVFDLFDAPTRTAIQTNITEIGNAVAGRGAAINATLEVLPDLLSDFRRVAASLSRPEAGLSRWIASADRFADALAATGPDLGGVIREASVVFQTLGDEAPALGDAVAEAPATLTAVRRALPGQRRLLASGQRLVAALRPGAATLASGGGAVRALVTAAPGQLQRVRTLTPRATSLVRNLAAAGDDTAATSSLTDLAAVLRSTTPIVTALRHAEESCAVPSGALTNLASALSDGDGVGRWLRVVVVLPVAGVNTIGGPAAAPAAGPDPVNRLRATVFPRAEAGHCEAGTEQAR